MKDIYKNLDHSDHNFFYPKELLEAYPQLKAAFSSVLLGYLARANLLYSRENRSEKKHEIHVQSIEILLRIQHEILDAKKINLPGMKDKPKLDQ